jgi:hypothetical protein
MKSLLSCHGYMHTEKNIIMLLQTLYRDGWEHNYEIMTQ